MRPYRCTNCRGSLSSEETSWRCDDCGGQVSLYKERFPVFYSLASLATQDASLKENLYDGMLGRFYSFLMPFLSLPVRPFARSVGQWLLYVIVMLLLATGYTRGIQVIAGGSPSVPGTLFILAAIILTVLAIRNPMFGWLLVLAVPFKLNHLLSNFRPENTFIDVHQRTIEKLAAIDHKLKVLDVSTGTCNSLLRHGWLSLNAEYFGIDLSETMLEQGSSNCADAGASVSLALADACDLPFEDAYFDIVLNYGAINGYSDVRGALSEMYRVLKPGGTIVLYDEQLYQGANLLENLYFRKVLSPHDVISECPVDSIPEGATYELHQVYPYYFLCIIKKTIVSNNEILVNDLGD